MDNIKDIRDRENFNKIIPRYIFDQVGSVVLKISPAQFMLLVIYMSHAPCFKSKDTILKGFNVSEDTFDTYKKILISKGLIREEGRSKYGTCIIKVNYEVILKIFETNELVIK